MNRRILLSVLTIVLVGFLAAGFITIGIGDPVSKTPLPVNPGTSLFPISQETDLAVIQTDNFDGANDTTSLKARGYKVWYRGTGAQGTQATWFQGDATVFPAYNGPTTGYVACNYQVVTGTNNIDSWLVLPKTTGGIVTGDSLKFYSRSPDASTYPDSMRVMYSASDSVPEGTWVELGRFKVSTAGWVAKSFVATSTSANGRWAIRYNVVNGGPSGANSDYCGIDALTISRNAVTPLYDVPELMYYKFENNTPGFTPNYASSPVGTNPSPYLTPTPMGPGGQFDSCLNGNLTPGVANLGGVNNGWLTVMPANWTIHFWMGNGVVDGNPAYICGDPGATSLRIFFGGIAGADAIGIRGGGIADVFMTGFYTGTAATCTMVFNGSSIVVYKNGVLFNTYARTMSATTGTGWRVGSYNTTAVSHFTGKLDEFRFYNRALTAAEVSGTWNHELPVFTGVNNNNNQIAKDYKLSQNYPNPFNPTTKINYSIPKAGNVKIVVFDVLGKEITTLVNDFNNAGTHTVEFNAANYSSGVYFYTIEAGDFRATKKMLLVK